MSVGFPLGELLVAFLSRTPVVNKPENSQTSITPSVSLPSKFAVTILPAFALTTPYQIWELKVPAITLLTCCVHATFVWVTEATVVP